MKNSRKILINLLIMIAGIAFIYPLIWMLFSSFKDSNEIMVSLRLLPEKFFPDVYVRAWKGIQFTYDIFLLNTLKLVIPVVLFTVISAVVIGYGFARFEFPFKNLMFSVMLATLMVPNAVIIIPRYIMFRQFGWLDSYLPFIIPAAFGGPFFIYMMVQFIRGLPRELDESACIDGCGPVGILLKIIVPLLKPAIISVVVFQFIWTWNNFFDSLIYINSIKKYTVQLALRMCIDVSSSVDWAVIMAQSCMALIPCLVVFFVAQKYFVEGIASSGMKN